MYTPVHFFLFFMAKLYHIATFHLQEKPKENTKDQKNQRTKQRQRSRGKDTSIRQQQQMMYFEKHLLQEHTNR